MNRFILLFALVSVLGCAGETGPRTVKATGVVTLDGSPVDKAQVIFIKDGDSNPSSAMTDAQGNFSLRYNNEKDGAIPGNYKVQVNKTIIEGKGGAEVKISHGLPQKYSSIVTSGLNFTVPENGTSDLKIELKSK